MWFDAHSFFNPGRINFTLFWNGLIDTFHGRVIAIYAGYPRHSDRKSLIFQIFLRVITPKALQYCSVHFRYARFCTPFVVSRVVCGRPFPLRCAVGHTAALLCENAGGKSLSVNRFLTPLVPNRGAAAPQDAIYNAQGCRELTYFFGYLIKK